MPGELGSVLRSTAGLSKVCVLLNSVGADALRLSGCAQYLAG